MKKNLLFFLKLIVVVVLFACFFLFVVMPQYTNNYQASMIDKVERLESVQGPKIVLVGNSNLAFGIDSAKIEQAFSMPVVNTGLHGGLGNAFNEQAAKLNVNKGDIYIICETNYNDNDQISNPELAWITIENHFELWKLLRAKDVWPMMQAYPTYLRNCLSMWSEETGNVDSGDCYSRNAFNEYGDDIYKRPESQGGIDFSFVTINHISNAAAKRLNKLNDYLSSRGATMLIAAYPIANCKNAPSDEEYFEMWKEIAEAVDCPVISDFRNYRYGTEYFYNTHLHLTDEGVILRTNQLIKDLEDYQNGKRIYEE